MSSFGTVFRHPPPCHDFLVDSVALPSVFRLGRVTCLGQWGDKKGQQRLEMCFCDWLHLQSCAFVIVMTYTCTGSSAGPKRMRDVWNWPELSFQLGAECNLEQWSPAFYASGTGFVEDSFSIERGGEMIQKGVSGWFKHIMFNWALYFYYYYISSLDHQELDTRGWGPLA